MSAPLRLDVAAALLALEPALLGAKGRLCRAPRLRPDHGFAEHLRKPVDGVLAVALLGAEALGLDHDDTVLGHALPCEPGEAQRGILRQRQFARVEAQLGRGRDLVDVLPARAGGADKADLDIVLVDDEIAGYPQHDGTIRDVRTYRGRPRSAMAHPENANGRASPAISGNVRGRQFDFVAGAAAGCAAACGARPTTTVRRPWPQRRFAAALASSMVTASTTALRFSI